MAVTEDTGGEPVVLAHGTATGTADARLYGRALGSVGISAMLCRLPTPTV